MALQSSTLFGALVMVFMFYQAQSFPAEFERRVAATQIQQELDLARKILDGATDQELADLNAMLKICVTKKNKVLIGALPTLAEDAFEVEKEKSSGRKKRNVYEELFKRSRQSDIEDILKNTKTVFEDATDDENNNSLKFEQIAAQGSASDKGQLVQFADQFAKVCDAVAKRVELSLYRRILKLDI